MTKEDENVKGQMVEIILDEKDERKIC